MCIFRHHTCPIRGNDGPAKSPRRGSGNCLTWGGYRPHKRRRRFDQRGLVKREASALDRRQRIARLTDEGDRITREMEHASLTAQAKFMEPLTIEKQNQLMALMTEMVQANNEYSRAPAGGHTDAD